MALINLERGRGGGGGGGGGGDYYYYSIMLNIRMSRTPTGSPVPGCHGFTPLYNDFDAHAAESGEAAPWQNGNIALLCT